MSSAWKSAASAVIDRPVISVAPAVVEASSTASVVAVPAAHESADADPVEEEAVEEEEDVDDDPVIVEAPTPQPEVPQEQEQKSSGSWWDWVKTKAGDAKNWVVGLLPGAGSDDTDEKSE